MIINVNCTIEALQEKAAAVQNALQENDVNKIHWLETLRPESEGTNPYEDLPKDELNEKFDQWMEIYFEQYDTPRTQLLEKILDQLLQHDLNAEFFNQIQPMLADYSKNDTGGIMHKSSLLIEKYDLNNSVLSQLPLAVNADDKTAYDTFRTLNRYEYEKKLADEVAEQLVAAIKFGLSKQYGSINPYFDLFNLIEKLAPQHPQILAQLQEEMVETLDIDHLDYDDYDSALFMVKEAWPHIRPYWSADNITALVEKITEVAEDEFSAGDAFVEDGVLPALKVIGIGNADAEKVILQIEKELAEYYDEEDN